MYMRSEMSSMSFLDGSILVPWDASLEKNTVKNYNKNAIIKSTVLYN